MKLIYLDMCCFNRPYDDQSQARIRLETEAKLLIQESIHAGRCKLAWSAVLDFECSKNPFPEHRQAIFQWRRLAACCVRSTPDIIATATQLEGHGLARFDALHVASALAAQVDIFVSTDDRLLKKCRKMIGRINAERPAEALAILENWYED
ncbi:PIN domain protein [Allochromatium palmeri]|uniref:PIN domain protein n=2 Tax=Allochromatium palmeri TaxID=231048 RepID=A0A6N8EAT2_9GAMM|nr:PIN domain protein [Allochromatium palmeri]